MLGIDLNDPLVSFSSLVGKKNSERSDRVMIEVDLLYICISRYVFIYIHTDIYYI